MLCIFASIREGGSVPIANVGRKILIFHFLLSTISLGSSSPPLRLGPPKLYTHTPASILAKVPLYGNLGRHVQQYRELRISRDGRGLVGE